MASRVFRLPLGVGVALLLVPSCVDDLRTEGDVPASPGATQPETTGSTLSASEACSRLSRADADARKSLDCDPSALPGCPERLRLAGSFVCAEIDEGSVDACVDLIANYAFCTEFDTRPCVVTVVRDTCVNPTEAGVPEPIDSGDNPDVTVPPGEGGAEFDTGAPPEPPVPEASTPEASTPAPDGSFDGGLAPAAR